MSELTLDFLIPSLLMFLAFGLILYYILNFIFVNYFSFIKFYLEYLKIKRTNLMHFRDKLLHENLKIDDSPIREHIIRSRPLSYLINFIPLILPLVYIYKTRSIHNTLTFDGVLVAMYSLFVTVPICFYIDRKFNLVKKKVKMKAGIILRIDKLQSHRTAIKYNIPDLEQKEYFVFVIVYIYKSKVKTTLLYDLECKSSHSVNDILKIGLTSSGDVYSSDYSNFTS